MIPAQQKEVKDQHSSKFDLGAIKTVPAAAVAAVLMSRCIQVDVAVIESAPARGTTSKGVQAPWHDGRSGRPAGGCRPPGLATPGRCAHRGAGCPDTGHSH